VPKNSFLPLCVQADICQLQRQALRLNRAKPVACTEIVPLMWQLVVPFVQLIAQTYNIVSANGFLQPTFVLTSSRIQ